MMKLNMNIFCISLCIFKNRNRDMPQLMRFGYYNLINDENDDSFKIVLVQLFWLGVDEGGNEVEG